MNKLFLVMISLSLGSTSLAIPARDKTVVDDRVDFESFTFDLEESIRLVESYFWLISLTGERIPLKIDFVRSTPQSTKLRLPKIKRARYFLQYSLTATSRQILTGSIVVNFE